MRPQEILDAIDSLEDARAKLTDLIEFHKDEAHKMLPFFELNLKTELENLEDLEDLTEPRPVELVSNNSYKLADFQKNLRIFKHMCIVLNAFKYSNEIRVMEEKFEQIKKDKSL